MHKLIPGLTACLFALPVVAEVSDADRTAIVEATEEWVATYNRNDWAALAELFIPNAVMMPPNSPGVVGREAISAWEHANENGFRVAFDVQSIDGSGDVAYVRGRSCVYIPLGSDQFGVDVGKYLEIRRRQPDGEWLIEVDAFNSDLSAGSDLLDTCPFEVAH